MSRVTRWTWTPVAQDLCFARAYHTCTPIRDKLYVYGGVRAGDPTAPPLDDIVTFDPAQNAAESGAPGGWFRSHHEAAALANRWLCVVGGWDGSRRLSSVCSYDTETGEWAAWTEEPPSKPPAGLSSHTCTKVSERELCVVGRQGGVRTHRRYASVYTLQISASNKTYRYKEEDSRPASRSGHCAALLRAGCTHARRDGHTLYVFGGRQSDPADWIGHWKAGKVQEGPAHSPRLSERLSHLVASEKAQRDPPKSLRHHSCSVVGPFLVVFGGESLGRSRDTVGGDLYVCDTRCTPMGWFHFPASDPLHKRVGHRTCLLNDRLYLVGGLGADGRTPCPEVAVLDIL